MNRRSGGGGEDLGVVRRCAGFRYMRPRLLADIQSRSSAARLISRLQQSEQQYEQSPPSAMSFSIGKCIQGLQRLFGPGRPSPIGYDRCGDRGLAGKQQRVRQQLQGRRGDVDKGL